MTKNLINKLMKKRDEGASMTVEFIVFIILIMAVILFVVDIGIIFHNKSIINTKLDNAVRMAAMFGGDIEPNTIAVGATNEKPSIYLKNTLGAPKVIVGNTGTQIVNDSWICYIGTSKSTKKATAVGQTATCEVKWKYNSLGIVGIFSNSAMTEKASAIVEVKP